MESLFDEDDGRRRRRHERNADALIRDWRSRTPAWSPTHAMAASTLRGSARALDDAEAVSAALATPYAAQCSAICARELVDVLARLGLLRVDNVGADVDAEFRAMFGPPPGATTEPVP